MQKENNLMFIPKQDSFYCMGNRCDSAALPSADVPQGTFNKSMLSESYFTSYLTRYRSRRRCPEKRAQNGTRFLLHHEHGFRSVRSTTWPPSSPIRKSCTTTWSWKWNIRPSGRLNREKYYKTNFAVMQFTARFWCIIWGAQWCQPITYL